ncbi:MAG: DUF1573 domain-containing protein [Pirellulales bacterium]|nr:DUF1573 domain-containing protein [Pirellulales bacterium]
MSRRAALAILLLLFGGTTASAQDWAKKMFETTTHDFGTVAAGSKIEFRFKFKNIWKEDVHVASVRSSCTCTTPTISKDLVKTREESELVATFNTKTHVGQRSATLTITFDQPFYAEVQLQVKGYIRSDIVVTPEAANFGTIEMGAGAEKRLSINYAGRSDWRIEGIKDDGCDYLEAELVEKNRVGGNTAYELVVRLTEDAPPGFLKQELQLLTNDRKAPVFPVVVEAIVKSEISVTPSPLVLGKVQPGQKVEKTVVVKATKRFKITDVTCADDCFTFQTKDEAKPLHLLRITFIAPDTPGKLEAKICIKTDLGEHCAPEVLVHANIGEFQAARR